MKKFDFKLDEHGIMKIFDECKFDGYNFGEDHEVGECSVAVQLIPYCKNVVEIGAGTGKVSHVINKYLSENSRGSQHLAIAGGTDKLRESGGRVVEENHALLKNKKLFNDLYTPIFKPANELSFDDLSLLNEKPDCLYVDCDNCLYDFFHTEVGKYVLSTVRFIANEMDGMNGWLRNLWRDNGFEKIGFGYSHGRLDTSHDEWKCEVWYNER